MRKRAAHGKLTFVNSVPFPGGKSKAQGHAGDSDISRGFLSNITPLHASGAEENDHAILFLCIAR
jgi:hypothetical protein